MLKCLVATTATQGERASDFCHAIAGELVRFGKLCCNDEDFDGGCGCARSLVGLESGLATTTFLVQEVDLSKEEFLAKITASVEKLQDLEPEAALIETEELLYAAEEIGCGAILEYRGGFAVRDWQK